MSHSSGINANRQSTVSICIKTESTLGIVEKVDKAIQTDIIETPSLDPCTTREERESKLYACIVCEFFEHKKKKCPFKKSQDWFHYL